MVYNIKYWYIVQPALPKRSDSRCTYHVKLLDISDPIVCFVSFSIVSLEFSFIKIYRQTLFLSKTRFVISVPKNLQYLSVVCQYCFFTQYSICQVLVSNGREKAMFIYIYMDNGVSCLPSVVLCVQQTRHISVVLPWFCFYSAPNCNPALRITLPCQDHCL